MSLSIQIHDVINVVANLKKKFQDAQVAENVTLASEDCIFTEAHLLFHAGLSLRFLVRSRTGLSHTHLNPAHISTEVAEAIVPDDLYKFFYTVLSPRSPDFQTVRIHAEDPVLHRHVLSLFQDLLYMASKGQCKTTKHAGIGIAAHQLTQSKDIVTMLNKHGHCISYDEIQRIDASWVEKQSQANAWVPVNMTSGVVTRGAGDNFNRATETLDGSHHDVVNMVLYQTASNVKETCKGPFQLSDLGTRRPRNISKEKLIPQVLQCPNLGGKQPSPQHLLGKINIDTFLRCTKSHKGLRTLDQAFILLRTVQNFCLGCISKKKTQ